METTSHNESKKYFTAADAQHEFSQTQDNLIKNETVLTAILDKVSKYACTEEFIDYQLPQNISKNHTNFLTDKLHELGYKVSFSNPQDNPIRTIYVSWHKTTKVDGKSTLTYDELIAYLQQGGKYEVTKDGEKNLVNKNHKRLLIKS